MPHIVEPPFKVCLTEELFKPETEKILSVVCVKIKDELLLRLKNIVFTPD